MSQLGFLVAGKEIPFAEALRLADDGTFLVPPEVVRALMDTSHEGIYPSGSVVSGCLRKFDLEQQVGYYQPVQSSFPALFGTAVHLLFEKYTAPHVIAEQRLVYTFHFRDLPAPYNEVPFGGKPDVIDEEWDNGAGVIRDTKSKLYVARDLYAARIHIRQLNIYNALRVALGHQPLRDWELFYLDAKNEPKWIRGPLDSPQDVFKWLRYTLHQWARRASRGEISPPVAEFFESSKKGEPVAPCSYCPVRHECILRWNAQQEEEHGEQAELDNDTLPVVLGGEGERVSDMDNG
jgi:hypothetical protein